MNHKYKVGEEVIYIGYNHRRNWYRVATNVIVTQSSFGDSHSYLLDDGKDYAEKDLYSPKEAIDYLTKFINKEE